MTKTLRLVGADFTTNVKHIPSLPNVTKLSFEESIPTMQELILFQSKIDWNKIKTLEFVDIWMEYEYIINSFSNVQKLAISALSRNPDFSMIHTLQTLRVNAQCHLPDLQEKVKILEL
eukprot:UN25385